MNRCLLGGVALCLAACAPKTLSVDLGDVEDYAEFLEERAQDEEVKPFKAEPLSVSATAKLRALPDIAVVTAVIRGEDKNESKAVDQMAIIVNAVQTALAEHDIETGFTAINSQREFDQSCHDENAIAWQRHNQIRQDYHFNRNLDRRGDTEIKRRAPKPRIAQRICAAQSIKVSTYIVIRIQPADAAGDALKALADAGAENTRLFGYDFTDYDSLYQNAAERAVNMAREKAQKIADLSGTSLGEIESFSVSGPSRKGRFGPQPNIIRPARPYTGQSGSVVDRQVNRKTQYSIPSPPPPVADYSCWDGSVVFNGGQCPSEPIVSDFEQTVSAKGHYGGGYSYGEEIVVIQEASTELVTIPAVYETVYDNGVPRRVVKTPASTIERIIPAVTRTRSRSASEPTTNALSMSLNSGPQTISVTANLSYGYETPLNGKVIVESEE